MQHELEGFTGVQSTARFLTACTRHLFFGVSAPQASFARQGSVIPIQHTVRGPKLFLLSLFRVMGVRVSLPTSPLGFRK